MTKLVSDLTKEELDYWVARARGWVSDHTGWWYNVDSATYPIKNDWYAMYKVEDYHPSTNGGQAMELVEKYKLCVCPRTDGRGWKAFRVYADGNLEVLSLGSTPMVAICRAVIASRYGEEVPDDE